MSTPTPAVTSAELASTAGRKTAKVRRKLKQAEAQLTRSNSTLVQQLPPREKKLVKDALQENQAAEEKVREATEELEVVTEMLADAQDAAAKAVQGDGAAADIPRGKTGQGAKSLIPHLRSNAAAKPPAE